MGNGLISQARRGYTELSGKNSTYSYFLKPKRCFHIQICHIAPCTQPRYPTVGFAKAVSITINQTCLGTLPGAEANWHGMAYIYANQLSHPPKQGCSTQTTYAAPTVPRHYSGSILAAMGQACAWDGSPWFTRIDIWRHAGHT